MIEMIDGLPDNVVGIIAKGRVTNNDCDKILKPAMESTLKRHDKVRLYYEIGCRFPGAAWEDLRIGIEHIPQWERIAVVTDVGWVRHTVNALRFLMASEVRVFTTLEAAEGRVWIASSADDAPGTIATAQAQALPRSPRASRPRSRRPSSRPVPRGDRRYRHPSAGGRQSR